MVISPSPGERTTQLGSPNTSGLLGITFGNLFSYYFIFFLNNTNGFVFPSLDRERLDETEDGSRGSPYG